MTTTTNAKDLLREEIVRSTTLCCLISIDYVGTARRPPLREMVKNEIPNVLRSITRVENLGLELERELMLPYCSNPKELVEKVVEMVKRPDEAINALREYGHCDMVFGAMKYMRKLPQSDEDDIDDMTRDVAAILGCECEDKDADGVMEAYSNIHNNLIRL